MKKCGNVLITGGNGYVASRLARHCLSESDVDIILWLHADSETEFAQKRRVLEGQLKEFGGRVRYSAGDLGEEQPFARVDPTAVDVVVHAAAVTRFNVEQELAQRVNVEGSEKLFKFCEQCPNLERLAYLSTVYSAGLRTGAIEETAFDGRDGFANYYESSKWAAETTLFTRYPHLPWQVFRAATVVAEDDDGVVGQYNAVHNTLKLLYYGLLPIVPGKPDTPLYFVTGRFVAEAIFKLLFTAPVHSIYHVAHTRAESLSLDELIELTFRAFNSEPGFSKRRVMRPLYTDQRSFARVAENVQGFGGTVMKQAVASVTPFSKQLFLNKDVSNARLVSHLDGYRAPDPGKLVERICAYHIQTRWGRDAMSSPLARAAGAR